jgi:hypothetical protein
MIAQTQTVVIHLTLVSAFRKFTVLVTAYGARKLVAMGGGDAPGVTSGATCSLSPQW